jgi:hypothetical protein
LTLRSLGKPGYPRIAGDHSGVVGSTVYRYRLIDEETGGDIGPLISARLTFAVGEVISRSSGEQYVVTALVEPESETFRAYIVVRRS